MATHEHTRGLQLALGCVWLLDALLQFQSFMLGHEFAAMLRATAAGNPAVIAASINWSAGVIGQHPVAADELFATTQLLIGLGIAWRPTLRAALAASVAWSVAIWWLGEGLGGLLAGTASPVSGAPGPALLYAMLAVLLWPAGTTHRNPPRIWPGRMTPRMWPGGSNPSTGTRQLDAPAVRLFWLLLWGGLAVLALRPATSAPRALSTMVAAAAAGQPRWLAGADHRIALALAARGPAAAVALSVVLGLIAVGVYLPRRVLPAILGLAMLTAGALWLAQGLGGMLTGMGTDPASGPLLALLVLACRPRQAPPDVQGPPDMQGPPDVLAKALACSAAAATVPARAGSQP